MAGLLHADLDELHKLAGTLTGAGVNITKVNATAATTGISAALPGSGLDGVCVRAGQYIDGAYQRVAAKLTAVGEKVDTASQWYLETDQDFADVMRTFDIGGR
jgi:hypothetical protein